MTSITQQIIQRFKKPRTAQRTVQSVIESDNTFFPQGMSQVYRDRYDYDRNTIQAEVLRAWRVNPLARRLVQIMTEYTIGAEGFKVTTDHKRTDKFIQEFWNHPLNDLETQINEWSDEMTRAGNLFLLCSVAADGTLLIRAVACESIKKINTVPNDYRQEISYQPEDITLPPWQAYDRQNPQPVFMLHYSVNRPVGSTWGESDLAPVLPWLSRYALWLEDRVRLNKYRSAFMYVVRGQFTDAGAKRARQNELNMNPPQPGSILVTDPSEDWGILSANLDSFDASVDGLTIKKMIAAGMGIPMHYLAEPEDSSRTTAEMAGLPTFKRFEQRQRLFMKMIKSIAEIAVKIRADYDSRIKSDAKIDVQGPDISERDNAALSLAVNNIASAFTPILDRGLIDEDEFLRLTYRFVGEVYPPKDGVKKVVKPVQKAQPVKENQKTGLKVDPTSGDVSTPVQ